MTFEPGMILTFVLACVGGLVWAVRVEGRVNGHDKLFEEREKALEARHEELQYRLERIEQKLDRLNGGGPRA